MKIAIVVPRFGEGVAGGAELLARWYAERLSARGDEVDVFRFHLGDVAGEVGDSEGEAAVDEDELGAPVLLERGLHALGARRR